MTESDALKLLHRAQRRVRTQRALVVAAGAFAAALLCAAGIVSWMRWSGFQGSGTLVAALVPAIAMVLAGLAGFFAWRPLLPKVAGLVDTHAGTQEHLVTWLHLRGLEVHGLNEIQRNFREAQKHAALRAADGVRLNKHMPLRWPAWTRAIWLALIILLSALLIPPSQPSTVKKLERAGTVISIGAGGGAGANAETLRDVPRVQVLSPAQLRKFELMATDPQLSAAMKGEALKELNAALGGFPESELTPEERQVLDMLRKEAAAQNSAKPIEGSVTANAGREDVKPNVAIATPAGYVPYGDVDKAWAAASESQFLDVRERLAKYYK